MAMNAYRNYNNNTSSLSSNLEKLSSGYKINRAGDDAAGLAISEKMRAQISGLEQAQSNVKDGISLVKTAEGAMQEVQDMLNRMVTLATQSANGTYDEAVDRDNLQKEVDQLTSEINRIADSANFNGIKLLDGSLDATQAAGSKSVDLTDALTDVKARSASVAATSGIFTVSLDGFKGNLVQAITDADTLASLTVCGATINLGAAANTTVGAEITAGDFAILDNVTSVTIDNIDYDVAITGGKLTFTALTAPTSKGDLISDKSVSIAATAANLTAANGADIDHSIQDVQTASLASGGGEATATLTLTKDMMTDGAAVKIGDKTYTISYSASYDATSTGASIGVKELLDADGNMTDEAVAKIADRITKAAASNDMFTVGANGRTLTMQSKTTYNDQNNDPTKVDLTNIDNVKAQFSVTNTVAAGKALSLQIGDTSDSYNQLSVSIQDIHADKLGIADVDISTQQGAQAAIDKIKTAINTISSTRGTLGATQNRLEHTQNNLSVMTENIQDAESTIRDTDIAEEMMSYTKNNILVQSAQAMLAQANSVPQGVLQLLQ
jgi:flagellin